MKRFALFALVFACGFAVCWLLNFARTPRSEYPTRVQVTIPPGGKSGRPDYIPSRIVTLEPRMITFPETSEESIDFGDIKTVPPWKVELHFGQRVYCVVADHVGEAP